MSVDPNSQEWHRLFVAKADGVITPEEHDRLCALLKDSKHVLNRIGEHTQGARQIRFTSYKEIVAMKGKALAFVMGGARVFAKSVHHPGSVIKAHAYLASSLAETATEIEFGHWS